MVADLREEQGRGPVAELGESASFRALDVTDERALRALAEDLADPPVNVLVNNAGAVRSFAALHEVDPAEWRSIVELNLTSVFLGMRFVIPLMLDAGGGSVINLSSISGVVGHAVAPAYQAFKGGVRVLTKNGAITYATRGARVNSLHPGLIATPMVTEQPQ